MIQGFDISKKEHIRWRVSLVGHLQAYFTIILSIELLLIISSMLMHDK